MHQDLQFEQFWNVIAAMQDAGISAEHWPEAVVAVAQLVPSRHQERFALASLERLQIATLVVNTEGAVHDLNAAARSLLRGTSHVQMANTVLAFASPTLSAAFHAALCTATGTPPRSSRLPLLMGVQGMCEVAVLPFKPFALVVITPSRAEEVDGVQLLRSRYGLTDAEARVTSELASGATVSEIARKHNVRPCTVRAQVRSIFEKTGVNRQSNLVRLAFAKPAPGQPVVRALPQF